MLITNIDKTASTQNDRGIIDNGIPAVKLYPAAKEAVDHPNHYNQGGVECIEALDAIGLGLDFCVGNALKYLWRFKDKTDPVEDLKKARWYITHAIVKLENGEYAI